jgi:hypothetical protein
MRLTNFNHGSDAAHSIHPLAGQGVNIGFGDAVALVRNIAHSIETGQELGSISALKHYESHRMLENRLLFAGLQGIKTIFEFESALPSAVRAMGLSITNAFTPVKVSPVFFFCLVFLFTFVPLFFLSLSSFFFFCCETQCCLLEFFR